MKIHVNYCLVLLCVFISNVKTQTVINIDIGNLLRMQRGNGWPETLHVVEGHEALLKLKVSATSQRSCMVTSPTGQHFDVSSPPNNRYERWAEAECGVRVKNVAKTDEGRWRITSAGADDSSVTGWSEVFVEKDTQKYNASPIALQDGDTNKKVELTTLSNSYCLVTQPFSQSSLIPGHCTVTLDKATRVVQGNWGVVLGLPGRVSELQYTKHIDVNTERLDFGYSYDSNGNTLNLYCNILHTEKNVTFCRFQKTSSATGFNVAEGLSDGRHSYYGEGFLKQECGMSIKDPTENDYGTWQCSVGSQKWVGNNVVQQTPMQALISLSKYTSKESKRRKREAEDVNLKTIFVQKDISFTLMCQADHSLKYCWFEHVNGTFYTPTPKVEEEQPFWYTGNSLQYGDCGITFSHATEDEAGLWVCHMGPINQVGVEVTDELLVRVTGPLAANTKDIAVHIGDMATLYCHTANGRKPLEYCRFVSPSVLGLSIDETVTADHAILDRYYFTEYRSLDYGDCSLTIKSVTSEDIGTWTCASLIHEEAFEASDVLQIHIKETKQTNRASVIGMSVGFVALAIVLVGVLIYKRGILKNLTVPWPFRTREPRDSGTNISLNTISSNNTNTSNSTNNSGVDLYVTSQGT